MYLLYVLEKQNICVTPFIAIFTLLWWSGTEPAISLRYACRSQVVLLLLLLRVSLCLSILISYIYILVFIIIICLGVGLFGFIWLGTLWAFWTWMPVSFPRFGKLQPLFLQISFLPLSLSRLLLGPL